jgi:hypothetical protein
MADFLTGIHTRHGKLWAAIDPEAHHLNGRVCERRFAAFCAPFRTEAEASEALLAAGAVLDIDGPTATRRNRGNCGVGRAQ